MTKSGTVSLFQQRAGGLRLGRCAGGGAAGAGHPVRKHDGGLGGSDVEQPGDAFLPGANDDKPGQPELGEHGPAGHGGEQQRRRDGGGHGGNDNFTRWCCCGAVICASLRAMRGGNHPQRRGGERLIFPDQFAQLMRRGESQFRRPRSTLITRAGQGADEIIGPLWIRLAEGQEAPGLEGVGVPFALDGVHDIPPCGITKSTSWSVLSRQ